MRKGFTLMELVVVVMILGILASVAIPKYNKTVETSRAMDAIGTLQAVSTANRVYKTERGTYTTGQLSRTHALVSGRYMMDADWTTLSYNFFACDVASAGSCCTSTGYACAKRKSGDYSGWGFVIDANGACKAIGGAPGCPPASGGGAVAGGPVSAS